jgi:nucleoside-diphosphate-sugar epimerase
MMSPARGNPTSMPPEQLTVAVTGPTGTFGSALVPLLLADDRVGRLVGIARRPFDPSSRGWTGLEYRRGDVREPAALEAAFEGVDVVVHLAFLVVAGPAEETRSINVDGTLNAFRAAARAGARRFVHASSVAAYGFHPDNPVGMGEDWPARPSERFFYAREKAELERLLAVEAGRPDAPELYVVRPPIVLGPDAVGGKVRLPGPLDRLARAAWHSWQRISGLPVPVPAPVPDLPLQLIHQDDVAEALRLCVVGAGPAGTYNIAADDVVTVADVARELGFRPVRVPRAPVARVARAAASRRLPTGAQWVEALTHPAVMDTTRARTVLGWTPRYSALEAVRATLAG